MVPGHPVIYIDDSDIVKPEGINLKPLAGCGMDPRVPLQKMSIRKVIM